MVAVVLACKRSVVLSLLLLLLLLLRLLLDAWSVKFS
jgi:hypothetical protein